MKNYLIVSSVVALLAFASGFWVSQTMSDRQIKEFAESLRLNEVHFVAVDETTGERFHPSVSFSRKGFFNTVTLPGTIQYNRENEFRLNWIDIEGMEGYITAYCSYQGREVDLREWAISDRDRMGGIFRDLIEIPFRRTGAQQASDGNAEKPPGVEREP